jgi:hypothetical protein
VDDWGKPEAEEEPAAMPEWGKPEALAVLAEAFGERLKWPVFRQCQKLALRAGGGDRLREYVSVAAMRAVEK